MCLLRPGYFLPPLCGPVLMLEYPFLVRSGVSIATLSGLVQSGVC